MRGVLRQVMSLWLLLPVVFRLVAPIGIMLVLWLFSSAPPPPQTGTQLRALLHNCAHVVAYFGLGGAWTMALLRRERLPGSGASFRVAVASVSLAVVYGLIDEWHQSFVPGRCCSVWDLLTDLCGSALAVSFLWWTFSGAARFAVRAGCFLGLGLSCAA
ncbi:MAG: VanZ family protein, partial [Planctomycetes bacterium]|nr:VanZ family protein [Planctomycetota bacterium]